MSRIFRYIRAIIRDREFVLLASIIGAGLLMTPLQRHISLSRFQHLSFAIFSLAVGCLLQCVLIWRKTSWWGRLALLSMSLYLMSFGTVCYSNPWLDQGFDLQTPLQSQQRTTFTIAFLLGGLPVGFLWYMWALDRFSRAELRHLDNNTERGSV